MEVVFSSDDIVKKSPNDRRLYRYIKLQNGLCAVLVHDQEIFAENSFNNDEDDQIGHDVDGDGMNENGKEDGPSHTKKKAAAAMCVGMGFFSDPIDALGLAHFLEHMLFMGSTEFPDENEYTRHLSNHGGSSNAHTDVEHTSYYFEVKPEFLMGALRRFSQFFISPLLKAEAMEREVIAVDSEFNQNLQSDSCRVLQLQCHTALPGHTFNQLFCGNKKSLTDAKEKGINLREQILKLYHDYYHVELMKLVIIGGETLDVLQSWLVELFSGVKNNHAVKPQALSGLPIWKTGKIYGIKAIKDVHFLELSWTLPCLRKEYLKKADDYLAHLIGNEGKGSLHFFLKAKGWVTHLSAGVGDEGMHRSSIAYIFSVSIGLTDSGLGKIYEIIGFVFQYLKLLRQVGPQEWVFKELQDIGKMNFIFAEEQPQDDYATELAENLLVYPPQHIIYGNYAFEVWDEEKIKYVLNFFTPDNMRIDVLSRSFSKAQEVQHEPWFGTPYIEENISPSQMKMWRDPSEIDVLLHLPARNEFIPCDFSVCAIKESGYFSDASSLRCILDEPMIKLWYKLDETFKLPRVSTYFRITLKGAYSNLKNFLLAELYVLLLRDNLNEIIYQASVAKLETSVSLFADQMELMLYGFNDKLPVLLSKVLETVKLFLPTYDRFLVIKEDLERTLRNINMKTHVTLQVLCRTFWDVQEQLCMLSNLTLANLTAFIPELFSQLYIEGLCHGNLLEKEAISISNIFKSHFSVQPLPVDMRHKEQVICFSSSADLVRDFRVVEKSDKNSLVEIYFQIEPELSSNVTKLRALTDLFHEIVAEPLFNQLRTKEQLGYLVDCGPRVTHRVLGFYFSVQSSDYSPEYLRGRIDNFINGVEQLLDGLDDESFENFKRGLIAKLLKKDPSLSDESKRYWRQITSHRYMFDFFAKEAEEVKGSRKCDVIDWYNTYLKQSSPKCRRLATRVWGCNTDMKIRTPAPSMEFIKDLAAFKTKSKFYPAIY